MSGIVIDASVAVAWCFADEASPAGDAVLARVRDDGGHVPGLWPLEVANVLRQAERRGRIAQADTAARLELLAALPIQIDTETTRRAWLETMALARSQTLTVYDAAYIELAMRAGLPIASKDREVAAAAERLGIDVLIV